MSLEDKFYYITTQVGFQHEVNLPWGFIPNYWVNALITQSMVLVIIGSGNGLVPHRHQAIT